MVNHPNRSKNVHAVLGTSTGGRGFIVEDKRWRYVITAAHCLPHLPPAHGMSYTHERTCAALLGPLGSKQQKVWAECLFVDPVADIAVLCQPDNEQLPDQTDAYNRLVAHRPLLAAAQPLHPTRGAHNPTPIDNYGRHVGLADHQ